MFDEWKNTGRVFHVNCGRGGATAELPASRTASSTAASIVGMICRSPTRVPLRQHPSTIAFNPDLTASATAAVKAIRQNFARNATFHYLALGSVDRLTLTLLPPIHPYTSLSHGAFAFYNHCTMVAYL